MTNDRRELIGALLLQRRLAIHRCDRRAAAHYSRRIDRLRRVR